MEKHCGRIISYGHRLCCLVHNGKKRAGLVYYEPKLDRKKQRKMIKAGETVTMVVLGGLSKLEYIEKGWKGRKRFISDEAFLQYVREKMKEESVPIMESCAFPEISWEFRANCHEEVNEFYGYMKWTVAGEMIEYSYNSIARELSDFFLVIAEHLKQSNRECFFMPYSTSSGGSPYSEVFRFGIRDKYDKLPEDLFLLGGIEWLNYVPFDLMRDYVVSDENYCDTRICIRKCVNGYFFIINKSIADVTIEDRKYMRKCYLDKFLMKAQTILAEDLGETEEIKTQGENLPVFDEELQLYVKREDNGTVVYGIEFIPVDFPMLMTRG